jgi:hypothetical protein
VQKSKLEKLIGLLRTALFESKAVFTDRDVEHIAIVVYDSMSNPGRNFHNINHIFDVAEGVTGTAVLAAIFHDIIYYQVDRKFPFRVELTVLEHIEIKAEQFFIKPTDNDLYKKLYIIFGVNPGDALNVFNGLNEFLSAIVAVSLLGSIITEIESLKLIGYIEATIPFRKSPILELTSRFKLLNFPHHEFQNLISTAIDFSNKDVFNFAESDSKRFLKNTWNLMSETNYSLRRDSDSYTVVAYRDALLKTYLFFSNLDPETVFTRFNDYPSEKNYNELCARTKFNIEIGRKYLAIQLISAAAINAIAECSGGDIPMILLMGEVRRRDQQIMRMEDYLGDVKNPQKGLNVDLLKLLEEGRSQESNFDMKSSLIGAFIYKQLGDQQSEIVFESVQNYFQNKISAMSLLKKYPSEVIRSIILACAEISSTRKNELIKLSNLL